MRYYILIFCSVIFLYPLGSLTKPYIQKTNTIPVNEYTSIIITESQKYNVDPALIYAIIQTESGFNPMARNKNDHGLAQINTQYLDYFSTLHGYDIDPFNPVDSIIFCCKHIAFLSKYVSGCDIILAYNAGLSRVQSKCVPESSYRYAKKVLELVEALRRN